MQLGGEDQRILWGVDLPEVDEADCALTITRTRCSTSGMAQEFADKSAARQWVWDRLIAVGVALSISAARPHPKFRGR